MALQSEYNICPVCHTEITVQESSKLQPQESAFFFVYCKHCGYGSSEVFTSPDEARHHWNNEVVIPTI